MDKNYYFSGIEAFKIVTGQISGVDVSPEFEQEFKKLMGENGERD